MNFYETDNPMRSIVEKVKEHCIQLLTRTNCPELLYHNVEHTLEVFENVQIIGRHEALTQYELDLIKIAALFHDTGVSLKYIGHEKISADNAEKFLNDLKVPKTDISQVVKCILATKIPQDPKSHLERIICDADLFHLASKTYMLKNELLRA